MRRKRCRELFNIFPVIPREKRVGGFRVDLDKKNEKLCEESITGIGIVARMVCIAASYLDIALPHEINLSKRIFEEDDLKNLRANVIHLCVLQGVPLKLLQKEKVLDNLWQLFHSPSLGRPVRQCMLDSDSRMPARKAKTNSQRKDELVLPRRPLDWSFVSPPIGSPQNAMKPSLVQRWQGNRSSISSSSSSSSKDRKTEVLNLLL